MESNLPETVKNPFFIYAFSSKIKPLILFIIAILKRKVPFNSQSTPLDQRSSQAEGSSPYTAALRQCPQMPDLAAKITSYLLQPSSPVVNLTYRR